MNVETEQQLYRLFANTSQLLSDGIFEDNGLVCVSTTRGANLTSERFLDAAKQVSAIKTSVARKKLQAATARENRRARRTVLHVQQSEKANEREEDSFQKLISKRALGRALSEATRWDRRAITLNRSQEEI